MSIITKYSVVFVLASPSLSSSHFATVGDNSSYRSSNDTPVSPAPSSDKLSARSERQRGGGAAAGGRRSPPQPVASPLVSDSGDFARPQPVRINSADTVDRLVCQLCNDLIMIYCYHVYLWSIGHELISCHPNILRRSLVWQPELKLKNSGGHMTGT